MVYCAKTSNGKMKLSRSSTKRREEELENVRKPQSVCIQLIMPYMGVSTCSNYPKTTAKSVKKIDISVMKASVCTRHGVEMNVLIL